MDSKQRRGCLWAALGAIVAMVMVGAVLVLGGAWFLYQSFGFQTEEATPERAREQFESLLRRFEGQVPLVAVAPDGSTRLQPRARRGGGEVQTIHIVVWNPGERRLVRLQVPFWLMRLSGDGQIRLGEQHDEVPRLEMTVEDLAAAGPGLLLDHTAPDKHRVLIWAE